MPAVAVRNYNNSKIHNAKNYCRIGCDYYELLLNMYISKMDFLPLADVAYRQHKKTQDLRNNFIKSTRKVNISEVLRIYLS